MGERTVIFASQNPGKIGEVRGLLSALRTPVTIPTDFNIGMQHPENHSSFEENARAKVIEMLEKIDFEAVVLGDDSGIEIDALQGEPGVRTRRWVGREMTDDEILEYCLRRLQGVPLEQRTARFKTVVAVGTTEQNIRTFEGQLKGLILPSPQGAMREGLPFSSVFYVPQWRMLLSETYDIPPDLRAKYVTHRVEAFQKALPYITALSE